MDILRSIHREERRLESELDKLQRQLDGLRTAAKALGHNKRGPQPGKKRGRRRMSAAGRTRIAAAQRARWAKVKAAKAKKAA